MKTEWLRGREETSQSGGSRCQQRRVQPESWLESTMELFVRLPWPRMPESPDPPTRSQISGPAPWTLGHLLAAICCFVGRDRCARWLCGANNNKLYALRIIEKYWDIMPKRGNCAGRGDGRWEVGQQLPTNLVSVSNCNWSWKQSLLSHRYTNIALWHRKHKSLNTLKKKLNTMHICGFIFFYYLLFSLV